MNALQHVKLENMGRQRQVVALARVQALVTTCWSTRAAASLGVAGVGPPHTVLVG
jgi:hypothetical protein